MIKGHLADNDIPESELTPQQRSTAEIRHVMAGGRGRVTRVSKLARSRVNGSLDSTPPRDNDESAREIRAAMDEPVPGEN